MHERFVLAALLAAAGCGSERPAADGAPPDAGAPDAPPNPNGIALVDVTDDVLGAVLGGGRPDDPVGIGTGAAVGDLDGDGDLDLILVRYDDATSPLGAGPPMLWWNTSAGGALSFSEDPSFGALVPDLRAHGIALGDLEPDGDLDVFLAAEGPDRLLANDGAGGFSDVTAAAGVAGRLDDASMGALFADVNLDGLLDLYVVNFRSQFGGELPGPHRNRLHVNAGDGTFVDVSAESGADTPAASWTAAASDLDGDGALDLYLANDQFISADYPDSYLTLVDVTAGVPHYQDRAAQVGVDDYRASMGVAIRDVDRDGLDDVYVTNWGPNSLFLATAGGAYRHAEAELGLEVGWVDGFALDFEYVSWGARFLDLDRDGLLELIVINGSITFDGGEAMQRQQDRFLREPGPGLPFVDATVAVGLPPQPPGADDPLSGRAVLYADLDGDGDDDLVVTPFIEAFRIYRNDTPAGGHSLRVRLRGTVSSPSPAGARLTVTRASGQVDRVRHYAGGDVHSWGDDVLTVGLADDAVTEATVEWPSGLVQRIDTLPQFTLDETFTVVEPVWLAVSARVATAADPSPVLSYDDAPGRTVTVTRSDGLPVSVTDLGTGSYSADLPHPGVPSVVELRVVVDGTTLRPRPIVRYR